MKRIGVVAGAAGLLATGVCAASAAFTDGDLFVAKLSGYEEVPAVSTPGSGDFAAWVRGDEIAFRLSYANLEGAVQQAHIHLGQRGVNGGVSAFLCSNLGNAPAGTPACPPPPAEITGTVTAEDVVGPVEQGIEPGEFEELLAAMSAGVTYVNVHSDLFPNGEIRGQLKRDRKK